MAERGLLTVKEAAEAVRVTPLTIRRAVADGSLRAYQLGGAGHTLRIPSRALIEWASPVLARSRDGER
jgi:excisionase family DNA binding protein